MRAIWVIPAAVLVTIATVHALTPEIVSTEPLLNRVPITQELAPEALAKKSGCLKCHGIDQKVVGPSYSDIARRYKNDSHARQTLIDKVRNGGKGNWVEQTGGVPMPPHSARLSAAEIARLVDWVLSQQSK